MCQFTWTQLSVHFMDVGTAESCWLAWPLVLYLVMSQREREGCCDLMGLKIWQVAGGPITSEKQPELND